MGQSTMVKLEHSIYISLLTILTTYCQLTMGGRETTYYKLLEQSWPSKFTLPQFSKCEIVYVDIIPNQVGSSNTEREPFVLTDLPEITLISASSGLFYVQMKLHSERIIKFDRFKDVHKHSRLCGVALFNFERFQTIHNQDLQAIFKQFIPGYGTLLRKDEDHFFFLTSGESQAEQLLLSEGFGSKIKYKVALTDWSSIVNFQMKTVHLYANYGNPLIRTLSFKEEEDAEASTFDEIFPEVGKNFHGKTFTMSIPKVDFRFEMTWNKELGKYVPKRGYYKWWLDEAMIRYNFTYYLFRSSFGGGTGKVFPNGTWFGGVADVLDGSADWAFVIGHIHSRHKFVEWSGPLSYEQMVFIVHKPRTFISPKAIIWPFSPLMWGLFLMTLLLVPLGFKWIAKTVGYNWTYFSMLEHVFATFLEQDHKVPYQQPLNSVKILGSFWLLSAMIISVAYRGKLASLLAFPVPTWIPTTFKELAQSNFRVALNVVGKGGAAYSILASSQSPVYKKLFSRIEFYPNPDECLLKAAQLDFCCITWLGVADYISARNLTDINGNNPVQQSTEVASFIDDGLVWEKRAVFRKYLDISIWLSIEGGLVSRWFQLDQQYIKAERWKHENKETGRTYGEDKGPKKLKINHLKGIYYMLFGGLLLSGIILLLEKIFRSRILK